MEHLDVPVFLKRMAAPSWPSPAPTWPTEMARWANVQRGGPVTTTGVVVDVVVVVVDGVGAVVVVLDDVERWCFSWALWGVTLCDAADGLPAPQALQTSARLLASATAPSDLVRIGSKLPAGSRAG
jgi:hypothetical protein